MGNDKGPRSDRKKLSWSYRNKKRQGQREIGTDNRQVQVQNKKARIIVRNLSFKVTEDDVRNLYKSFGEIEQIELLRRPDGKPVGCGFVQFKRIEDASKAIFKTNKQEFLERPINVTWAVSKSKFNEQLKKTPMIQSKNEDAPSTEDTHEIKLENGILDSVEPKKSPEECKKLKIAQRKQYKLQKRKKSSRIIIRNLPFAATEQDLKDHFSQYGAIEEVNLLTKPDGQRIGCGFIQYDNVQSASKAIHYSNLCQLMGRLIVVDWAVSKTVFKQTNKNATDERESQDVVTIEEGIDIKSELEEKFEEKKHFEKEEAEEEGDEEEDEEDDEEDIDTEEETAHIDEEGNRQSENDIKEEIKKHPRVFSHDVNEGKTIFLTNVPFSIKNEELKKWMEQVGPVEYALVCMDSLTEHSKGTAFVKFRNLEDAEKCLMLGTDLQIHGEIVYAQRAVAKQDIINSKFQKANHIKDSRNLYLIKEGLILAGSPAASDVSVGDMTKRLQLEQWKSQILRNLNMFVSRVRLVVHNLPITLDDMKLRTIFKKHAGEKAVITEARVMRDMKNIEANGLGKSKEFGFVTFTTHDDALRALRNINNNPNIFSKTKRPIVAFSIENRVMVNVKKRRIEKSRDNNPLWKMKRNNHSREENVDAAPSQCTKKLKIENYKTNGNILESSKEEMPKFSGVTSRPGDRKMRSKFKVKTQAQLHMKAQKNAKKDRKMQRKLHEKIIERHSKKDIRPKQGAKKLLKEERNLDCMVQNYRSKLSAALNNKLKWYDT